MVKLYNQPNLMSMDATVMKKDRKKGSIVLVLSCGIRRRTDSTATLRAIGEPTKGFWRSKTFQ